MSMAATQDAARHRYFAYVPPKSGERAVRDIALLLLNRYSNQQLSRTKWKAMREFKVDWKKPKYGPDGKAVGEESQESVPMSLEALEAHIESERTYDFNKFRLFDPRCNWLDASVDVAPHFHAVDQTSKKALTFQIPSPFGENYPYHAALDREGRAFSSFQGLLLRRVGSLRARLVERSDQALSEEWFQDFRTLVSECVSLVDTTLHQIYFKAKYDPLPGWKFDEAQLGVRHGRRVTDKFGWVYKITGNHLNADDERRGFVVIKDLRNHLQHFDPPSFCFSLEDAVIWLNEVLSCARLNLAIRQCVGSPLSVPLIELLLQPKIVFVPEHSHAPRVEQAAGLGYSSTNPARDPQTHS
jgi:hypothetical protein